MLRVFAVKRNPEQAKFPTDLWALIAAAFVIAVGYGLVAPVLPQFARSFDVSISAAAAVISVFALARLLFAPVSGTLVERFGERSTYITGILVVAASSAACAFAGSYWELLLFRGLGGIGSTMFTVSAMGLLIRLAPPAARGRVTSAYSGAFLLGGIAGPVAGGALAQFGLHLPFIVYSGALVVAAGVVVVAIRPGRAAVPGTPANGPSVPQVLHFRQALGQRSYRAALGSAFATGWASFGVRTALVPLFAVGVLHAGSQTAGASLAVFAVGTAVALPFAGKFADLWGRKPLILAGLLVNGGAMAALGFTTTAVTFVVVSAIAGIGSGLLAPAQQASVADIIGSDRRGGKVLAGFQMSQDLGTIVGPVAAGALVDLWSYGPAFAVAGGIGIAAALYWLRAPETLPLPASP